MVKWSSLINFQNEINSNYFHINEEVKFEDQHFDAITTDLSYDKCLSCVVKLILPHF